MRSPRRLRALSVRNWPAGFERIASKEWVHDVPVFGTWEGRNLRDKIVLSETLEQQAKHSEYLPDADPPYSDARVSSNPEAKLAGLSIMRKKVGWKT